jgi:FMN phosphatase YigB (HAD superfamily)
VSTAPARWIVLDVGETLIDETRLWSIWAKEMGISPMTLMAAFGAVVARGQSPSAMAELLPVADWRSHRAAVEARYGGLRPEDLYPDVSASLPRLRQRFRLAVLGNQPAVRTAELRAIGVDAEVIVMSEEMGVEKPDPAFFRQTLERLGRPDPASVAYVGDRVENDVIPAQAAGLRPIWLRRGPWGRIRTDRPPEAALIVDSLTELADRAEDAWR